MAQKKYSWGLSKLEMSNIASDGDVGTSWSEVGDTEQGSAVLTEEEGTTQEFRIEEADDPVFIGRSEPGAKTFTFSTLNVSPAQLVALKGGTATGDGNVTPYNWDAPDQDPEIEKSIRITTRTGQQFIIPRAKLISNFDSNFGKENLAKITIVATVLKPTKAGVPPLRVVQPLEE